MSSNSDLQIIEVFSLETFYICNVYNEKQRLPTPENEPQAAHLGLKTVERVLQQFKPEKPTIIAGDFNLHHS